MSLRRLATIAVAVSVLAAPALAQLTKEAAGRLLKESEVKAALLGSDMEGYSPTSNMLWKECIQPDGQTIYEMPTAKIKGRLLVSPAGKACFSYEDDGYATVYCFALRQSAKGLRFEGDDDSVFITTKLVPGIKSCTRELVG